MKYAVACRYADRESPREWPNGARAADANNQACLGRESGSSQNFQHEVS